MLAANVALALAGALCAATNLGADPAPGTHRIAFINSAPASANVANVAAFRARLADLGYVEGRNLVIDFRYVDGKNAELPALARELLGASPAIVVSTGGPQTVRAVKAETTTVPVVFIAGDPVGEKVVANLAHPAGNLTGFSALAGDLEAKRLEVLRELLPNARRVAVIWNPALLRWKASNAAELGAAFAAIASARPDALYVVADPYLGFERTRIVAFAADARLPAIYFWREFVEVGGLASYGTNLAAVYRRVGIYVDKILKSQKPGELPVEQPTMFELVVNRSAARAVGITVPASVLGRADEVIQ